VLSYARVPKQGYHILQQVYQPVLVGADIRRDTVLLGCDLGSHDRPFQVTCWLVNDRHAALAGCQLQVRLQRAGESAVTEQIDLAEIAADSVTTLGIVTLQLPPDLRLGTYELELTLRQQAEVLSQNSYPIKIVATAGARH
jgi:hypothetical protein